ncbi:hypothetical protein LTR08_002299 [Meristemomyces frigidus]|nr:hypothetical protein LTR08_002299 [Meristemomyces frigidus]
MATVSAFEFLQEFVQERPLPSLPSPTLTNPDMVLPSDAAFPTLPSPQGARGRPPSLSYLTEQTTGDALERLQSRSATPKKEKRGLMSRKMMLLRSRTGSGMNVYAKQQQQVDIPRSAPLASDAASEDYAFSYASSPTLRDVGNLASVPQTPEEPEQYRFEHCQLVKGLTEQDEADKRASTSGSSMNSEDLAGIPSFLAKYKMTDGTATDDELFDSDSPAPPTMGYSVSIEGGLDAHRRQQEEDEHNSAILSQRAEHILANAKRRLNLMEGNLRGARDLVIPLTAANLKRATSVGSSQHLSSNTGGGRFTPEGFHYVPYSQQRHLHALQPQASSPTMGRDFQGHLRGFSESKGPEMASTALGRSNGPLRSGRIPVKANDGSWTQDLRSSKSHDSLGSNRGERATGGRPLHAVGSPEPMAPLAEDDGSQYAPSARNSCIVDFESHDAVGISRPTSKTDDLREQIGTLKGKISSLKERAREDRLKRQGLSNLRTPSPFNNAAASPPEYFYTQSPTYSGAAFDSSAGVGRVSRKTSPVTPHSSQSAWEQNPALVGSRNAFAERVTAQHQPQGRADVDRVAQSGVRRQLTSETRPSVQHKRTASGTAVIEPATNRYSHHQITPGWDMPGAYVQESQVKGSSSAGQLRESYVSPLPFDEPLTSVYDHEDSEDEQESVYADAEHEQAPVVPHEDRVDAFSYEHFFLHSAMGGYGNDKRGSISSEQTLSSVSTAKGPTAIAEDEDERFNPNSGIYPPPTPETPERLREIERHLHKRTFSDESVSSTASFATAVEAVEDAISPSVPNLLRQASALDWPILPTEPISRIITRTTSRSSTANHRAERRRDCSSERADSGVGLPRRSISSHERKRSGMPSLKLPHANVSNPSSTPKTPVLQDPATLIVNALLDPMGRPLGLKDKALLFGLVENLRKVCRGLQDVDDGQYESRVLRRRLDDAKRALGGELIP